jgi:hypothetical protein
VNTDASRAVLVLLDINSDQSSSKCSKRSMSGYTWRSKEAPLGTWCRDVTNGRWTWDDNTNTILGLPTYAERNELTHETFHGRARYR